MRIPLGLGFLVPFLGPKNGLISGTNFRILAPKSGPTFWYQILGFLLAGH